jgi:CheY-like chemotaxis protein
MACLFTAHLEPLADTGLIITAPFPRGNLEEILIRVVLIEDDHLMREWLGRSLSSRGHAVRRFARADEALTAVLADMPDVVVTDIRMPGMSGIEFGRRLRARGIDVPIIFMTADADKRLDEDARALGSRWMLRKPFNDVADLWCAVDEAHGSRSTNGTDPTHVSHALRTPLTAVRMALTGLLGDRELAPRERHLADIAKRNLDRLEAAVEAHLTQLTPETETVD